MTLLEATALALQRLAILLVWVPGLALLAATTLAAVDRWQAADEACRDAIRSARAPLMSTVNWLEVSIRIDRSTGRTSALPSIRCSGRSASLSCR